MPKTKKKSSKKKGSKKKHAYKDGDMNMEPMVLGGAMFPPGSLVRVSHPQLGSGWMGMHPVHGAGFFSDIGNFFKNAGNAVYSNVLKPAASVVAPIVRTGLKAGANILGSRFGPAGTIAANAIANPLIDKVTGGGAVGAPVAGMSTC